MHRIIPFAAALMLASCSSTVIQSPSGTTPVALGGQQSNCTLKKSQKQWGLLFGVYPFKKAVLDDSVLSPDRSYRIKESYSWQDATLSILGGAVMSLNVKTIDVEECDQRFVIRTPAEIEKEEEQIVQAGLDLYMKLSSNDGGETVLILKSGETKIGRIESLDERSIVLLTKVKPVEVEPVDRIVLRGGQTVLGTVLRQSKDVVVVRTSSGLKHLNKKDIQTILYYKKKASADEKKEDEESTERVTIARNDIRRIVLREAAAATPSSGDKRPETAK
ncbi:MAG: hypothetical protein F9K24_08730 [Leptonema illini]|jgi:hypothetical protein|uniref:Uncharacterized protein n=1 Tax=Leptonema illini TaxID=183 RepID=A0A833M204_9LEPT|nr:MAG: hypothetical protein F9K24_08730 [Leptonema illini]